jgi:POT family proton-dependent oligopeptide transporter
LGERFNWHWGFGAAGVGMTIGLIQYVLGRKHLDGAGEDVDHPATEAEKRRALVITASVLITGAVLFFALKLFGQSNIGAVTTALTIIILMVPIWYFRQILSSTRGDTTAGPRIRAFIWIFIAASLFWMIFEQAGSTLTVFADEVTNLAVTANFSLPVSWLQSLNPLYVVIFAPVFSVMLLRLGDRAPRTSIKFAIALLVVGLSFLLLILPMREFVNSGAQATVWWLVIVYLLQTWAELLLSPTGLSATTKLAPVGAVGMFMALWFLTSSVGTSVGGLIASWTDGYPVGSFAICGGMAVAFGLAMMMAAKKINASMGEVH